MFPLGAFSVEIVLVSDDIRFSGILARSPNTAIRFEGGRKRKYLYGVSYRSLFSAPINGRGRI